MSDAPTKQFFLCGTCAREVQPKTFAEFEALELNQFDNPDGSTIWVCPRCDNTVFVMVDDGMIEFGI